MVSVNRSSVFVSAAALIGAVSLRYFYRQSFSVVKKFTRNEHPHRALEFLTATSKPCRYIHAHISRLHSPYEKDNNEDGYINLAIAENKITYAGTISSRVSSFKLTAEDVVYDDNRGCREFRQIVAKLLTRHSNGNTIEPDNICAAAGVTAVVELLLFAICDPTDGILVPVPYFTGFKSDFARVGVELVPTCRCTDLFTESMDQVTQDLDRDLQASARRGVRIRALLTSNPHNPTGKVLPLCRIEALAKWAEKNQIHLVIDEVYANSIHSDGEKFVSAAVLKYPRVHTIYGFAKDFAMAGARAGILHTRHEQVLQLVTGQSHGREVSLPIQRLLTFMLQNPSTLQDILQEHRLRLCSAYQTVLRTFKASGLPDPKPAQAGLFVLLDWRKFIHPQGSWEGEHSLWKRILDNANVNLTPGEEMGFQEPGWFRLCFGFCQPDVVEVGIRRLAKCLIT